jgi:hypothetical protein
MDEHELHHGWLLALLCSATAGPKSAFADRPSNLNNLKKKTEKRNFHAVLASLDQGTNH